MPCKSGTPANARRTSLLHPLIIHTFQNKHLVQKPVTTFTFKTGQHPSSPTHVCLSVCLSPFSLCTLGFSHTGSYLLALSSFLTCFMSAQAMLTNTFSNQNTKAQRKAHWSQFYFTFSKKTGSFWLLFKVSHTDQTTELSCGRFCVLSNL